MPEQSDTDFDALKRKARRRLVGAVVLALAAAVFVPMLLESEQKPLGDDVSVHIPPVDDGKFVNRLNAPGAMAPPGSKAASGTPATPPGAPDATPPAAAGKPVDTPQGPQGTAPDGAPGAGPAPAPPAAAPPAKSVSAAPSDSAPTNPPGKSLADAEHRVLGAGAGARTAAPSTTAAPANDAKRTSPAKPSDAPAQAATSAAAPGAYVVQLAAFSDDKGANALSNRLKKAGYTAYTEPVTTTHGTLWRVRVGPFGTRDDANATRDRLKHEGYSGLVAANPRTT